jgi:hypothetical protein
MSKKHCNEGLDDRCRDRDGQIRAKNGNTLVRTLRETYGEASRPVSAATSSGHAP